MPYQLVFEHQGRGVIVKVTGALDGAQCLEATQAVYDPAHSLAYQIWDFSACERLSMEPNELHAILLADKAEELRNPEHRAAIVTGHSPVASMTEAYRTFGKWVGLRMQIRGFADLDSARAWAGEAVGET